MKLFVLNLGPFRLKFGVWPKNHSSTEMKFYIINYYFIFKIYKYILCISYIDPKCNSKKFNYAINTNKCCLITCIFSDSFIMYIVFYQPNTSTSPHLWTCIQWLYRVQRQSSACTYISFPFFFSFFPTFMKYKYRLESDENKRICMWKRTIKL